MARITYQIMVPNQIMSHPMLKLPIFVILFPNKTQIPWGIDYVCFVYRCILSVWHLVVAQRIYVIWSHLNIWSKQKSERETIKRYLSNNFHWNYFPWKSHQKGKLLHKALGTSCFIIKFVYQIKGIYYSLVHSASSISFFKL